MTDLRACFLGDSYVLGVGDEAALGWPGRVTAAARARGHDLSSYNLGVRGQTGAEVLARAVAEATPRLVPADARAMIISFGNNDLRLGRPTAESRAALEGLIAVARALNAAPFVVSPPRRLGEADEPLAMLSDILAEAADKVGAPWLDMRSADIDWELWQREAEAGDGAHPGAASYSAYALVFDTWPDWRAWLQEAKGTRTQP